RQMRVAEQRGEEEDRDGEAGPYADQISARDAACVRRAGEALRCGAREKEELIHARHPRMEQGDEKEAGEAAGQDVGEVGIHAESSRVRRSSSRVMVCTESPSERTLAMSWRRLRLKRASDSGCSLGAVRLVTMAPRRRRRSSQPSAASRR